MPPTYHCQGCGRDLGVMPRAFCRSCADVRPDEDTALSDNPERTETMIAPSPRRPA